MALVAWYPLNEDAKDYSGKGNNGTVSGATLTENGIIGGCYTFATGTNNITAPSSSTQTLNYKSISVWINPISFGESNAGRVVEKASSYILFLTNSTNVSSINFYQYWTSGYNQWSTPASSITLNKWNHICVVYDGTATGNTPLIYINGILQTNTVVNSTGSGSVVNNSNPLYIGNSSAGTRDFVGNINDIKIYDHLLSRKEVEELSRCKIVHYKFNQPNHFNIKDCSGYMYDVTNNGFTYNNDGLGESCITNSLPNSIITTNSNKMLKGGVTYMSISCWVNPTTYGENDNGCIISRDQQFTLRLDGVNSCLNFMHYFIEGTVYNEWSTPINSISTGDWFHVVLTYDRGVLNNDPIIYTNGVSVEVTNLVRGGAV